MEALNSQLNLSNKAKHDNSIKEIYSCGRNIESSTSGNFIGIFCIISLICYIIYQVVNKKSIISLNHVFDFAVSQDIFKLFISILLLLNVKTLSDSFVYHILLPIIKPILPFIVCNLKLKIGLFNINLGEFMSDILVFLANLYAIYIMYILTH